MEELKLIMDGLAQMGEVGVTAFIWWCVKEVVVNAFCPLTFGIICFTVFKLVRNWQNHEFSD